MSRSTAALIVRARCLRPAIALTLAMLASVHSASLSRAITIEFDYSYDVAGFFGTAAAPTPARTALEFAGRTFDPFFDSLAAIQPGGTNAWNAIFRNPGTGLQTSISNLAVPQDVIRIFAGARNLSGSKLGEAGPGFYSFPPGSAPTQAFSEAIVNRAQGPVAEDFAPWGGFIEFDTIGSAGSPRKWHLDVQAQPDSDAFDFYTVAVHELAHLFGFGTSSAFSTNVTTGKFRGAAVTELYGGPAPMHADNLHWAATVGSPPYPLESRPKPSLGPSLAPGERKLLTPLDYAALADIGWQAPPELLRLPGDADLDNHTDGADFLAWQQNLGGFGGSVGDVDGNLFVDDFDGWIIRQSFGGGGATPIATGAAASSVPEPAAASLAALAIAWLGQVSISCRKHRTLARAG
jgi:hypothetical protein